MFATVLGRVGLSNETKEVSQGGVLERWFALRTLQIIKIFGDFTISCFQRLFLLSRPKFEYSRLKKFVVDGLLACIGRPINLPKS